MILVITCAWDTTANAVIAELTQQGADVLRLNTEDFPGKAQIEIHVGDGQRSRLSYLGRSVTAEDVEAVYYRRPERPRLAHIDDESTRRFAISESWALVQGFLRLCDCAWLNHPARIAEAEFKPVQLRVADAIGFALPRTLATNTVGAAETFLEALGGSAVAKTVRSPVVSTDPPRFAYTHGVTARDLDRLHQLSLAPVIFQERVSSIAEYRVTVVGDQVFSARIDVSPADADDRLDWRRFAQSDTKIETADLPSDVARRCEMVVSSLDLEFGAIDLVQQPEGEFVFLECNPNGEWGWVAAATGLPIAEACASHLIKLARRQGQAW